MFVTIKDLEIALNSKSYLDHVFKGIIIKRKWWIMPFFILSLVGLQILLNNSKIWVIPNKIEFYLAFPFLVYLFFALILGLIERTILKQFYEKKKEERIKKLKLFFYVSTFITFISFTLCIGFNYHIQTPFLSLSHIFVIFLKLLVSLIITFVSNPYTKEITKIEEKGFLLDKNESLTNSEI